MSLSGRTGRAESAVVVFFAAVVGVSLFAAPSGRTVAGSITVDGRVRTYLLHIPPQGDSPRPMPLVLAFHGGGGQGPGMERLTRFDAIADREGFLVAYPDGVKRGWNDERGDAAWTTWPSSPPFSTRSRASTPWTCAGSSRPGCRTERSSATCSETASRRESPQSRPSREGSRRRSKRPSPRRAPSRSSSSTERRTLSSPMRAGSSSTGGAEKSWEPNEPRGSGRRATGARPSPALRASRTRIRRTAASRERRRGRAEREEPR
jgi:hypothetical protein